MLFFNGPGSMAILSDRPPLYLKGLRLFINGVLIASILSAPYFYFTVPKTALFPKLSCLSENMPKKLRCFKTI